MGENEENTSRLLGKIKDERVLEFFYALEQSIKGKVARAYTVTNEFKYVLPNARRCSLYIRPASTKVDIYLEKFLPADISLKNKSRNLPLIVKENTANPKDQFKSVIRVDRDWLAGHQDKANDLIDFILELVYSITVDYACNHVVPRHLRESRC